MKRVLIFDLQFQNYVYHSTPQPSMFSMLVAGFHKAKGHSVTFTDTEPKVFNEYDIVYINKDEDDLFHKPQWLKYPNVVLIGRYWEGLNTTYNLEWEKYPPDITIYHGWLNRRAIKYPKYNPERLEHFYYEPVKIRQGARLTAPSGNKLLIIDFDLEESDPLFEHISNNVSAKRVSFLYPISLDKNPKQKLAFLRTTRDFVSKKNLWLVLSDLPTEEQQEEFFDAIKTYPPLSEARIKLDIKRDTNEGWLEVLPKIIHFIGKARQEFRERILVYPRNQYTFKYPRILQELKRWTGSRLTYEKNTCIDYILVDGCRNTSNILSFLEDPVDYIEKKRQGTNKLFEVYDFILEYPEIALALTAPYQGRTRK